MVKINRIYTKSGDDGTTALGAGGRVGKTDPRVEAYGTVDEANAAIGLSVVAARAHSEKPIGERLAAVLEGVQQDLFDVGADLCVPIGEADQGEHPPLRVTAAETARLEPLIDEFNEDLSELRSFVLPGGCELAASLHLARTVVRRAERRTVALRDVEPETTGAEPVRYLNRLSDLLFVLSRAANAEANGGSGDVLWVPGSNRGD